MKVVILCAFLIAGAAAAVQPAHQINPINSQFNKNIIEDALALYECLMRTIPVLQDSINNVVTTVNGITDVIDGITSEFDRCLAIGGENPSIIDQIAQAACLRRLFDTIRDTIATTIADVQNSVAQVVIAGNDVMACF